jgi:hypothetical protein
LLLECAYDCLRMPRCGLHPNPSLLWGYMAEIHRHVWHLSEAWVSFRPFDDADAYPTRGIVETNCIEFVVRCNAVEVNMKNRQGGGGSVFVDKYKRGTCDGVMTSDTCHHALAEMRLASAHFPVQKDKVATPELGTERLPTGHGLRDGCADEIKRCLVFHAGYSTISRHTMMCRVPHTCTGVAQNKSLGYNGGDMRL